VKKILFIAFMTLFITVAGYLSGKGAPAYAGEQGHYSPMPIGVRDTVMPPKGFYLCAYDMYYGSDTFRDSNGIKLESISAGRTAATDISIGGQSVPVTLTGNLAAEVDMEASTFAQLVPVMWAPGVKLLGADYAFLAIPSWGYTRINVEANVTGAGTISVGNQTRTVTVNRKVEVTQECTGLGDFYVQPVWLDWRGKHYDLGISYGVWCPTGYYNEENLANVGLGFWTQQVQGTACYYLFGSHATALLVRPTYEWHSNKIGEDVQPGQNITLEYGLSHFINPRAEVAVLAYSEWQLNKDRGDDAINANTLDRVSGIGAQVTCWAVQHKCAIIGKFNQELGSRDRLEGTAWSLNLTWVF